MPKPKTTAVIGRRNKLKFDSTQFKWIEWEINDLLLYLWIYDKCMIIDSLCPLGAYFATENHKAEQKQKCLI